MVKFYLTIIIFFIAHALLPVHVNAASSPPPQAKEHGYLENTFASQFKGDVDIQNSRRSGSNWYLEDFYGEEAAKPADLKFSIHDGIIINSGNRREIATATRYNPNKKTRGNKNKKANSKKWVGKAFGGGGYFEAELKFDSKKVLSANRSEGWPAFWGMSIEHRSALPQEQWVGQPKGFVHYMEVDIFEYLYKGLYASGKYGTNMHKWYGMYRKTCPGSAFCKISLPYLDRAADVPKDTSFDEFHKYGFLWIPATKTTEGFAQFFFDGQPVGKKITWEYFNDQPPSPNKMPWTYGVLDRQHLILLLGTGNNMPMTVRSVNVWQKSDDTNLISRPDR